MTFPPFPAIGTAFGLISLLLALAGCEDRDPYRRTDVWQPTGANAGNIAAQIADPRDLIRGRASGPAEAHTATAGIERLWDGKPRALVTLPPAGASTSGASTGTPGAGGS